MSSERLDGSQESVRHRREVRTGPRGRSPQTLGFPSIRFMNIDICMGVNA